MNNHYETCPFPKPRAKKKKKKQNGWKEKKNRVCAYCGEYYAERHELFGGPNRQISIDEGFQIDLCRYHHEELHRNVSEWAKVENKALKSAAQKQYMDKLIECGMSEDAALKAWMNLIGRNYRDEMMPE